MNIEVSTTMAWTNLGEDIKPDINNLEDSKVRTKPKPLKPYEAYIDEVTEENKFYTHKIYSSETIA